MSPRPCWRCGAPWRCERCGSFEQRPGGKGCAECHRRSARRSARRKTERELLERLDRDEFEDIVITPVIRSYLAAFDRYVAARRDGDTRAARHAEFAKADALNRLTTPQLLAGSAR